MGMERTAMDTGGVGRVAGEFAGQADRADAASGELGAAAFRAEYAGRDYTGYGAEVCSGLTALAAEVRALSHVAEDISAELSVTVRRYLDADGRFAREMG